MAKKEILPIVALVGRPNVGKSTLFNRIVGSRKAVVHPTPGLTRDRNYSNATWNEREFVVVDTGGYEIDNPSKIYDQMREQSQFAIEEADSVVFMCDVQEGFNPTDMDIANMLRRSKKPFVVVINKCDNSKHEILATEFYTMGIDNFYTISAQHGLGVGELLDDIVKILPERKIVSEEEKDVIRIALVGRQNVGKSTMVNAILGEERVIANPLAGTTRDSVDSAFNYDGQDYVIIDTAGIRRRGKVAYGIEKLCVLSSQMSMEKADVAVLVIDAEEGVINQDGHIGGFAYEQGCGLIIAVNKWDLVDKETNTFDNFKKEFYYQMPFLNFAPIISVSAKTNQRVKKILSIAKEVVTEYRKEISTHVLNEFLKKIVDKFNPPMQKGRHVKIKYITQISTAPIKFALFVNEPELVHFSYERYIINQLREEFGFVGVPIKLVFKKK